MGPRKRKNVALEDANEEASLEPEAKANKSNIISKRKTSGKLIPVKNESGSNSVRDSVLDAAKTSNKHLGFHASTAGGVFNALIEADAAGCRAVAFFLRSSRSWKAKPLEDSAVTQFKDKLTELSFDVTKIVPHGSYLMNCGSPDPVVLQKSRDTLLDEVKRCGLFGIQLYNIHPGSTCGKCSVEESIGRIADCINYVHSETAGSNVVILIENMAAQGHTIGGCFEELRDIIAAVTDKSRIGICLDTCHAWAAGFDVRSRDGYAKMMTDLDEIVGLKYLKAVHVNDSKGPRGSRLDRHESVGLGKIGTDGLANFMTDSRFNGLPMILETPDGDKYPKEMIQLYNMDAS